MKSYLQNAGQDNLCRVYRALTWPRRASLLLSAFIWKISSEISGIE